MHFLRPSSSFLLIISIAVWLAACGGGGSGGGSGNSLPLAINVSVTDFNGNIAVPGDILIGNYVYSDSEGDAEGATAVQWSRNGLTIIGATALTYTLVADDAGAQITFKVSPVALTGSLNGLTVTSSAIDVTQTYTFSDTNQSLIGKSISYSVEMGDMDNDGDLDIVIASGAGQGNNVYKKNSTGNFTNTDQFLEIEHSNYVALGDIDNDGDLDMVAANQIRPNTVFKNDGSGVFTDTNQSININGSTFSITLGQTP